MIGGARSRLIITCPWRSGTVSRFSAKSHCHRSKTTIRQPQLTLADFNPLAHLGVTLSRLWRRPVLTRARVVGLGADSLRDTAHSSTIRPDCSRPTLHLAKGRFRYKIGRAHV